MFASRRDMINFLVNNKDNSLLPNEGPPENNENKHSWNGGGLQNIFYKGKLEHLGFMLLKKLFNTLSATENV